ncbi:MAG: hypothetical protein ACTSX9_00165 [Candidatus Njordarchaeales archaeon]
MKKEKVKEEVIERGDSGESYIDPIFLTITVLLAPFILYWNPLIGMFFPLAMGILGAILKAIFEEN